MSLNFGGNFLVFRKFHLVQYDSRSLTFIIDKAAQLISNTQKLMTLESLKLKISQLVVEMEQHTVTSITHPTGRRQKDD